MSPNAPHRAQCCACCKTVTLRADMNAYETHDGSHSRLTGKLICRSCDDALTREAHEESAEYCECGACGRDRNRCNAHQLAREAATYGGLRAEALGLLGLTVMLTDLGLAVDPEGDGE